MGVARLRCAECRGYFPRDEAYRVMGMTRVCSEECYSALLERRRRPTEPKPASRRARPKPRLDPGTRKRVRSRDGGVCRWCGKMGEELHHIAYRSQGGSDNASNLILLCQEHHMLVHSDKRRFQPLLFGVLWMGYTQNRWMTIPEFEKYYLKYVVPSLAA